MRRAQISRWGEPSAVVELIEMESPAPGPGEVRVKVEASPIHPSDLLKCRGLYGYGESVPMPPFWGGVEGVGQIVDVGAGVDSPRPGARVTLARLDGIWGEQVIAPASGLTVLPDDLDPLQAAMLIANPPTAELMLTDFVALEAGDWVIQNAANSAVGRHVIALAKHHGWRTINLVRRQAAIAPLEADGGDVVLIDGPELEARVRDATGGALAELAIDAVGGAATARIAGCLAPGATVLNYGLLSGEDCRVPARLTIFNDIRLQGFLLPRSLGSRTPGEIGALYKRLLGLVIDGVLRVEIEATYPLAQIGAALDHADRAGRTGKILITP